MDIKVKLRLYDLVRSDDNIESLRKLLSQGLDPNLKYSHGNTLLHAAAKSTEDNVEIVQELLKAGADVNKSNSLLCEPLHIAVIYRKRKVVEALLKSKIHVNNKDAFGKTALHYSVNNSFPFFVPFSDIPLHARVPDPWIVKKLLDHKDIDVNEKNVSSETPLMQAVKDKHLEIVKLLLNKKSRLDASNEYGQTALHMALIQEDPCPYIVVLLLLKRATLLKMNIFNETPLNIIINSKSLYSASICLKVIALSYCIKGLLINKIKRTPELLQYLNRCYDEINRMNGDVIANELTVFKFLSKSAPTSGFHNPILQIYKPVVERIITGLYPEYFCYILHRISKSNLLAVLKVVIVEKHCEKNCDVKDCKKEHPTAFSELIRINLLSDYLSSLDIFRLIIIFSSVKIDEYMLNFREHDCYLTDSWEEYPDGHFY
ncbi:unnamed protein product [Larinioides sclopetarius]|uniref:Ankyrin repeat protein n=1 Tax=Larinioides sclopetarius TaxID=280406 RepID=A0AAV2A8E9_9ARAC